MPSFPSKIPGFTSLSTKITKIYLRTAGLHIVLDDGIINQYIKSVLTSVHHSLHSDNILTPSNVFISSAIFYFNGTTLERWLDEIKFFAVTTLKISFLSPTKIKNNHLSGESQKSLSGFQKTSCISTCPILMRDSIFLLGNVQLFKRVHETYFSVF